MKKRIKEIIKESAEIALKIFFVLVFLYFMYLGIFFIKGLYKGFMIGLGEI